MSGRRHKARRRLALKALARVPDLTPRRSWWRRALDWARGIEVKPVDRERLAIRSTKRQHRRWLRRLKAA